MPDGPQLSPADAPALLEDHHVGLLDVDPGARRAQVVALEPGGDEDGLVSPAAVRRLCLGLGTFLLAIASTYVVSGLSWAQPWPVGSDYVPFWNLVGREFMGHGAAAEADEEALATFEALARTDGPEAAVEEGGLADRQLPRAEGKTLDVYPPYRAHADDAAEVEGAIEGAEALDGFFAALTRTELGQGAGVTRVSHWGDSVLGNDGITGNLRLRMQTRFGDAGHGFHSLVKYDASYRHQGIKVDYRRDWKRCYIIRNCKEDGHYGLGGVTAYSGGGSETVFRTPSKGAMGRHVSRFELWYAAQPGGGRMRVTVDGGPDRGGSVHVVETQAEALEDRWAAFELPDGPHEVSVRATGGGQARAYGVVMERDAPGVVWDGMALIGAFTKRFTYQDPDHLAGQLAHRDPDLIVLTFGGNDLLGFSAARFEQNFDALVTLMRASRPEAACLVTSVVDHGERKGGAIVSVKGVDEMVEIQRRVALEHGCAFFDIWTAMGGSGAMGRWHRASPRLAAGDLHHLSPAGHKVVGGMIHRALMAAYRNYREHHTGAPLESD